MDTSHNVAKVSAQLLRASVENIVGIAEALETFAMTPAPDPAGPMLLTAEESLDLLDALDKARAILSTERRMTRTRDGVTFIDAHVERLRHLSVKFSAARPDPATTNEERRNA